MAHLTAWSQPGGGHLRHIPLQPPYRDPCATSAGPPILRSFSGVQEGPRTRPRMSLRMDPKGTENGLPKGAQRGLSKPDFKRLFSEKFCNIASLDIVSRCIASRRANVRSGSKSVQETEAGQTELLFTAHSPPLKSFRCIHSGVVFWFFFELWD